MISSIRLLLVLSIAWVLTSCSDANSSVEVSMITPALGTGDSSSLIQPSQLSAGEIDDNSQWEHHIDYRDDFLQWYSNRVRDVDVSERQIITVADAQGLPVMGARILIYGDQELITETRTYANGSSLFFPSAWVHSEQDFQIVVQKEDSAVEFTLEPQSSSAWRVELDSVQQPNVTQLDILFLLDATGSMGDEIAQLQNNILSISTQVNQFQGNVDVRYGLVIYRDRGDDYVVRTFNFVDDVERFQTQLNAVRAAGGGDKPESLNEGLHAAIQNVNWRGDNAIKLVFLVADAPPHLDYPNDYDYSQEMIAAAWQGIKIFSIASSGLPLDGEFVFRQLAQYTMGRFIFLTYQNGTSGQAGTERTDLTAGNDGNYTVEQLDELVLKLIEEEVAASQIPVDSSIFSPQVTQTTVRAKNVLPASFALVRPQVQQTIIVEQPVRPQAVPPLQSSPGSVSFLLVIVMVAVICLLIGYNFSASQRVEKRKRKNDESVLEVEDW